MILWEAKIRIPDQYCLVVSNHNGTTIILQCCNYRHANDIVLRREVDNCMLDNYKITDDNEQSVITWSTRFMWKNWMSS